jgi:hypothetical protein
MARHPAAPFIAPYSGDPDQRLAIIADALSRKADQTSEPAYNAVLLRSPDGSTWRVTVSAAGVLTTAQVTRP